MVQEFCFIQTTLSDVTFSVPQSCLILFSIYCLNRSKSGPRVEAGHPGGLWEGCSPGVLFELQWDISW